MYELIIEMAHTVWKNGFSLTALGTAVYVLLKQRAVKKRLRRFIPWLLADDSETKHYVANQARIEMKVDLLLQERGIEWSVLTLETSANSAIEDKASSTCSTVASSAAQGAVRRGIWSYTNSNMRRRKFMNKFKSRKFWMAVITGLLIILNDGLDLGIDQDTVLAFAGIMATFILGEAGVDAVRSKKAAKAEEDGSDFSH